MIRFAFCVATLLLAVSPVCVRSGDLPTASPSKASASAPAASASAAVPPLPREQIVLVYRNGDLDSVLFYLKQGRLRPVFLDKTDSSVAFKYLGVIYASEDASREKGRYYFNQLLRLDPRASITELLPGEKARAVFREVREEFFELHPELANAPPPPAPQTPASPDAQEKPAIGGPHGRHVWWWVAGGVIVAGAAGATVALLDPKAEVHRLHD